MTEQEKEATQPVVLNGSPAAHSPEEGTQPVKVAPGAPQVQLPDWLLKFASSTDQATGESDPDKILDFETPFFAEMEDEQDFTPPVIGEENAWQELSNFQDQELLEFEPELGTHEILAEDQAAEASLVEEAEAVIAVDPQVEAADMFKLEVRNLLKQGQRAEAFALIRENKADPILAEAAKKTLRSQLTLSSDTSDLWEIYDELESSSHN